MDRDPIREVRDATDPCGFLALALVAGACGGDDDTASDDTSASGGGAETDDGPEADDGPDDGERPADDRTEPADDDREDGDDATGPDEEVDIDAVCEVNRELAAAAESAFGEELELESAGAAVSEFSRLLEEMAASAPADLSEDLLTYRDALAGTFELIAEYGFDPEAVPQEAIDEYAARFPDANLFGPNEMESRLREWFEANCPEPFAF